MASSSLAGPSSKTIEYYTASESINYHKAHRRRRRRNRSNLCSCGVAIIALPHVSARATPVAPPTTRPTHVHTNKRRKRAIPQYWEFVDGEWVLSDDWRLYGVKGKKAPARPVVEADGDLLQEDLAASSSAVLPSSTMSIATSSLSATATSSAAPAAATFQIASVSTPAGWGSSRERTAFYTVPLIILASILIFCSIFGIIGGVTMKRSRRKAAAKAKKKDDVESASSSLNGLEGKARMLALAKRKMRKTKLRIVRGARRKPVLLVVPSDMMSGTRLTASALNLQAMQDSGVLRQRPSIASRHSIQFAAASAPSDHGDDQVSLVEEPQELEPTNSRTALTNEDAQSASGPVRPIRRRSIFSSTFSIPTSNHSSRRGSTVASPPAYGTARTVPTPSYATAIASSASISPAIPALTARQAEKAAIAQQHSQVDLAGPSTSLYPDLAEQDSEDPPLDRSLYVAHVATDDKTRLRHMHALASAPTEYGSESSPMDESAPAIHLDEDGFEDHSEWLEDNLPPPQEDASTSRNMLPEPPRPIEFSYGGLGGQQSIASAPPMPEASIEEEASAPPMWEGEDVFKDREDHVEV